MNWKKYKSLPAAEKQNEAYYIIGLDLGSDSTGMAYFNLATNSPESIDLSGGYGKPSVPTVMQYIPETKEWVFGEYAVLNRGSGTEITLHSLVERLGSSDYVDVDRRSLSVASILALFIKEILGNVRSINPKAEIVGIVATVPAYFSDQAYEELRRAFKLAGYEKELIDLVPDRECVLTHYFNTAPRGAGRILLLDFGARELRGGLYSIEATGAEVLANSMSSLFSDAIGMTKINNDICEFFEDFVRKQDVVSQVTSSTKARQLRDQTAAFSYQHRDMLFQKNIRSRPIKAYFNFTYPPFQQTITHDAVQNLMRPYARRFDSFVRDVLGKSISHTPLTPADVDAVLCVGGGFEMLWAREAVIALFKTVHFYKNPKMVTCEGAAIAAARALDINEAGAKLILEDRHQLTADIGLSDGQNFLPLVERNAFWWQNHPAKLVIVNQSIDSGLNLNICMRSQTGEIRNIGNMPLSELPARPKGVTRLEVELSFETNADIVLTVRDAGFGELFPKVEYRQEARLRIV